MIRIYLIPNFLNQDPYRSNTPSFGLLCPKNMATCILMEELVKICIVLGQLLIIYEGIRKNEIRFIQFLNTKIEKISKTTIDTLFIEKLISQHNYFRKFDNKEVNEAF